MNSLSDDHQKSQKAPLTKPPTQSIPSLSLHSAPAQQNPQLEPTETNYEGLAKVMAVIGFLLLGLVAFLFSFNLFNKNPSKIDDFLIRTPLADSSTFRSLSLSNELKVFLEKTNDGTKDVTLSLGVGVGNQNDPKEFPGLFDLISKALLKGSRNHQGKHPLKDFVLDNNGELNIKTNEYDTMYTYRIKREHFRKTLDIFVDALLNPSFDDERVSKCMEVVKKHLQVEFDQMNVSLFWRFLKALSNPKSTIFNRGLDIVDVNPELIQRLKVLLGIYHKKYYSSNLMTLVVISDVNMDEMESIVRTHFRVVPNRDTYREIDVKKDEDYQPPFLPDIYGRVFYIKTQATATRINFITTVKSTYHRVAFDPFKYLEFWLNYKTTNSLIDWLEEQNLVQDLRVSKEATDRNQTVVIVKFILTKKGVHNVYKVVETFFQYIYYVSKQDLRESLHKKLEILSRYIFLVKNYGSMCPFKRLPDSYTESAEYFARNLQYYKYTKIMSKVNFWYKYVDSEFKDFLKNFRPQNMFYVISSGYFPHADRLPVMDPQVLKGVEQIKGARLYSDAENHYFDALKQRNDEKEKNDITHKTVGDVESTTRKLGVGSEATERIISERRLVTSTFSGIFDSFENRVDEREELELSRNTSRRNKMTRFLNTQVNKEEQPEKLDNKIYKTFFYRPTEKYTLDHQSGFEYSREFHVEKIEQEDLANLWEQIISKGGFFQKLAPLDENQLFQYRMITKCPVPRILQKQPFEHEKELNLREHVKDVKSGDNDNDQDKEKEHTQNIAEPPESLDLLNLLEVLRYPTTDPVLREVLIQTKTALVEWKICMMDEFKDDDSKSVPDKLTESEYSNLFFQMYRKSFQPLVAVEITLYNPRLFELLRKSSPRDQRLLQYKAFFVGDLLKKALTFWSYRYLYTGGEINFYFTGLTTKMKILASSHVILPFIRHVKKMINNLQHPDLISAWMMEQGLEGVKARSSWNGMILGKQQAKHSLLSVIDVSNISYHSTVVGPMVMKALNEWDKQQVSDFFRTYVMNSKMTFFVLGNLTPETAMAISSSFEDFWFTHEFDPSKEKLNEFQPIKSVYGIYKNFLFDFVEERVHYMVRFEDKNKLGVDSTYLTYFYTGELDTLRELLTFVFIRMFKTPLHVAMKQKHGSGVDVEIEAMRNHLLLGIQFVVSGSKLDPLELEVGFDQILRQYIDDTLASLSSAELADYVEDVLINQIDYKDDLFDILNKQNKILWKELLFGKARTFYEAADMVDLKRFQEFVSDTFVQSQRRISVEVFKTLAPEAAGFQSESALLLGDLAYEVIDEQQLIKKFYDRRESEDLE